MNRAAKGSRLARQIAGRAGLQMAALNLALFVLFGALYLGQGVRLQLLGPLEQARERLVRKLEDRELALADPPEEGLAEELRFLRTLERDGLDLTVVLENDRAVWYDERADAMTEGALAAPFVQGDAAPGIRLRTAPGHGWMAVASARVEDPAGGRAGMRLEYGPAGPLVLVWDQGVGIPPEEQGRVFDRFYRGVNRTAAAGEGLGLAIARQLSQLLDAPIRLERTGPEGSLFSLHPPAAREG